MPCVACGILVPQPGMEPVPPALGARSLNHRTAREVLLQSFKKIQHYVSKIYLMFMHLAVVHSFLMLLRV